MRIRITATTVATVMALVMSSFGVPASALPEPSSNERVEVNSNAPVSNNRILVRYRDTVSASDVSKVENKQDITEVEHFENSDITVYEVENGKDARVVASELLKDKKVEIAEPDYDLDITAITNDQYVSQYWGLDNYGQVVNGQVGIADVDINAPQAWNYGTGNNILVAVLDTGTDIYHPDLTSHIWSNPNDCDYDGVDDDGNGYTDDCHGWDFFNNDNTVYDAYDGDDHGTHVSGTIAAIANNGIGGAGVAPNATIVPLKFIGPNGGSTSGAIAAIEYAKNLGVRIVNCSWGGGGESLLLKSTMLQSGMLFVTSAGNSGVNIAYSPTFPAAWDLPNQVVVAAVDNRANLAGFSNYGGSTDVGAPGVSVLSTIPKRPDGPIAIEYSTANYKTAFWGFGLEDVVGPSVRADLLDRELKYLGATPTDSIVVVDDDASNGPEDTVGYYTAALAAKGYSNTSVINISLGGVANHTTLAGSYVIWETGYSYSSPFSTTLTPTDQAELIQFLNAGGRLLVAGSDAIYDIEDTPFVETYLGVLYINESDPRTTAYGIATTPMEGVTLNLSGAESPAGIYNSYHDKVAPNTGAIATLFLPGDPDHTNAYGYKNGTSMAAPHVTGIAALVAEIIPAYPATTVAGVLRQSVRLNSTVVGKVRSNGIADASAAVWQAWQIANPPTDGYRFVASDGGIFAYGNASFQGSVGGQSLNQPVVGIASTPDRNGYWLVARDGGIFGFGAGFYGSTGGIKLNQPIVGIASTPSGHGYWLVARDGGIFAFGDARFHGSTGNIKLFEPIVGMASTPSGNGYWLVASDGGIFAFGDAGFYGSIGGKKLNKPIVGMASTPTGNGYWMVASDGGIFAFGDAGFYGSTGGIKLNQPIVGIASTSDGDGYWLTASDGGIFAFGNAGFFGSTGNIKLNKPIVALAH